MGKTKKNLNEVIKRERNENCNGKDGASRGIIEVKDIICRKKLISTFIK